MKKVAVIHDWLTGMRGGEKVLEAILELFPQADVFTLVLRPEKISRAILKHRIFPSALQRWPLGKSHYRHYLPLFHHFMSGFDLSGYDLLVSSSSGCAKWVRNPRGVPHVCYCHTPMRYIWGGFEDYFGAGSPLLQRLAARFFRPALQARDLQSNSGVSHFIANSGEVKRRIGQWYGRRAVVIHPPVDVGRFSPAPLKGRSYYLVLSALVPYKRVDLAVAACSRLGLPLVVAGEGPEKERLRAMAGPTVRFLGWVDDSALPRLLGKAKALLFPGREDFGMVPVEALAAGCPVLAFGQGGVLDSLKPGRTGLFFARQEVADLEAVLRRFEAGKPFQPRHLAAAAARFSKKHFMTRMKKFLARL